MCRVGYWLPDITISVAVVDTTIYRDIQIVIAFLVRTVVVSVRMESLILVSI